jgi:hypothetical protein
VVRRSFIAVVVPALPLVLALGGCPGDLAPLSDGGGGTVDTGPVPDTGGLVWPDVLQAQADGLPDTPTAGADQGSSPDQAQPDLGVPGVGGSCPCKLPLICVNNACRQQCTAPTDACKAKSNCPSDHGCISYNGGKYHVCLPAVKPGAACGGSSFCPVNHVCGSVSSASYICLPTCSTLGASCGTTGGGVCVGSGCLFCSKP